MSTFLDRFAVAIVALVMCGAVLFFVGMLVYLAWIHPQALLLYAGFAVIIWSFARISSEGRTQRQRVERRKLG